MESSYVLGWMEGLEVRGTLLRVQRFQVECAFFHPDATLRVSQAVEPFKVFLNGLSVYAGRAVVASLVHTGNGVTAELRLEDPGIQPAWDPAKEFRGAVGKLSQECFDEWSPLYRVEPAFKLAVLDLENFLRDMKLLCDHVEIGIRSQPPGEHARLEQEAFEETAQRFLAAIDRMHERFEEAADRMDPALLGVHRSLVRRHLQPYFLPAPFGFRTHQKPLGYAGDYEIMNMIHRNGPEGGSLFARMVHLWLVRQWAAESVRNRIAFMHGRIVEETLRAMRQGRVCRILNIGCGPCREVSNFIQAQPCADHAAFTLVDFDPETLGYVQATLAEANRRAGRRTQFAPTRMSVQQLLKFSANPERSPLATGFDLVYCGGLFDYFSDRVCRQLTAMYHAWTVPGGLTVVANMSDHHKAFARMIELLLDWILIYRDVRDMEALVPAGTAPESWRVYQEPAQVNLFLELRKPGGES